MASARISRPCLFACVALAMACGRSDRPAPPAPPPASAPVSSAPPATSAPPPAEEPRAPDPAIEAIDTVVTGAIARGEVPGAVVLVLRSGEVIHRKAYGLRAKVPAEEPMTVDTVFDLASLTKPLATATAIMLLVEEGKLTISDRAAKYFPVLRGAWGDVTLEHLLLHTSGLPPDHAGDEGNDPVAEISRLTALASPGERFLYSDLGYVLLAKIAEKVGERPLDSLVQRVFLPLGMRDTTFRPGEDLKSRAAPTTTRAGVMLRGEVHDPRAARMGGVAGHAGLFGTAEDLGRFTTMLLGGGEASGMRVLGAETVRTMTKPRRVKPKGLRALGWDVDTGYSHPRGEKFPVGGYGHTGFSGTSLWIDPKSRTAIIVLASRLHPDGKGDAKRLRREVANAVADAVRAPKAKVGLDVLAARGFTELAGKRIGVVTHKAATNEAGVTAVDVLRKAPGVTVVSLFSPEHGLGADQGGNVPDQLDARTGLPIHSLYGTHAHPTRAQLAGLDALVVDLVDVGARFFTYESTLAYVLESAAESHVPVVVLDRPNPLGGELVEGPMLDAARTSFVGVHPLPIRHGLTMGELARLFAAERHLDVTLTIVPTEGWKRSDLWEDTGLAWSRPSPNLGTLASAQLYPGVALLEMTNVSVGRGTDTPFGLMGAPFLDGKKLAAALASETLPGVTIEATTFTPTASAFVGRPCGGVRLTITDAKALRPVRVGLALMRALRTVAPAVWEEKGVDVLLGAPSLRMALDRGDPLDDVIAAWDADVAAFAERRKAFLLYGAAPLPSSHPETVVRLQAAGFSRKARKNRCCHSGCSLWPVA